jgi:PAS domain S-box-containing protein
MVSPPNIGLSPFQLSTAFPFHFAFDPTFTLCQIGSSLALLCPGITEGSSLFEYFKLERPILLADFESIIKQDNQLFVLQAINLDVKLRGQMIYIPEANTMLFLGSPWLTEPEQIGRLGLTLSHFALHDASIDLLQFMQSQKVALADTQKLAKRLSLQKSELREINDALKAEMAVRKNIEEELHEGESTFQILLESASEGIVIVSQQGIIKMVNARLVSLFGYSRMEMLGQPIEMLIPKRLAKQHVQHRINFIDQPRNRPMGTSLDLAAQRKDGNEFPVDISLSYVQTRQGLLMMAFIADVTERKQIEMDLAQARDQAMESSRLKSEFLATMSHEIRTPMNSIIGITDLLIETGLDAEQEKLAKLVKDSGADLLNIINDILDTSKIEAGKLRLESINFDLRAEIEIVTAIMSAKVKEKQLVLTTQVEADVPRHVNGDPGRLRQILINLLNNAIKFTMKGTVELHIALETLEDRQATIFFSVKDTGIGIPAVVQNQLFQPFMQADGSTTRKFGGTGLGLAICRKLVGLMGGRIGVDSQDGIGSTFWFTVSYELANKDEAPKTVQTGPSKVPYLPCQQTGKFTSKILLVEDNEVNTLIALKILERLGYCADRVTNGLEALEALRQHPYRLVLMDCQMPVMDGFDATRAIRALEQKSGSHVPIVAMTANAMIEDREKCLLAGMDDYISKPVDRNSLALILEHWILQ